VGQQLATADPLVYAGETRQLLKSLAQVQRGNAFLLQAGDCAESFDDFSADRIRNKLQVILQMALVLTYSGGVPVVKVGRIAGQFAKPRSAATETINGLELPVFRGHIVSSELADARSRRPDATRLWRAYQQSLSTLGVIRSLTKGGFSDLSQAHAWNQEFVGSSPEGTAYDQMATEIDRAMRFMRACGIDLDRVATLREVDLWTSHEALLLDYEAPLTRLDQSTQKHYATSAAMVWIGERTRGLDDAHIEYARGIANPVGLKLSANVSSDDVITYCRTLNPERVPGKLTLVARLGADNVVAELPRLLNAATASGVPVIWSCDPMHGNTFTSESGRKTRKFDDVVAEVKGFFEACRANNVWPGGIHVELTGDNVTECIGGIDDLSESQLDHAYETICDPRLNARQSLDLAFRVGNLLQA
jgi:3-deoxy-7-phosphoheptulonate synthase